MAHWVGKNRTNVQSTYRGHLGHLGLPGAARRAGVAQAAGSGSALPAAIVVALLLRRGGGGTRAQER